MAKKAANTTNARKIRENLTYKDLSVIKELILQNLKDHKDNPGEIEYHKDAVEIQEINTYQASDRIKLVANNIVKSIQDQGVSTFNVPIRSSGNIIYDDVNDLLLLGHQTSKKNLLSLTSAEDATRLMKVLELINELLSKKLHATKREIFYGDVNLFKDQKNSDKSIEDCSALLHTTRGSTNIVAGPRGTAIGRLRVRDGKNILDLEKLGKGGWTISRMTNDIDIIESDAEFILVVEKDAAMLRLAEAEYWKKFPCIILTASGAPNVATRSFLRKVNKELKLPTLCLVDADPYGHYIYSVYIRGSKRLSYESKFLATSDMKLLGVLAKDLDEYRIPENCRIPMDKKDKKRLDEMLHEDYVKSNKKWEEDLKLMRKISMKAEIQALSTHGFEYLTDTYLPNKISSADWIN